MRAKILLIILSLLPILALAHSDNEIDSHHSDMTHLMAWNGWGMMGGFGWVFLLLFLILVVLGIIALVKYIKK